MAVDLSRVACLLGEIDRGERRNCARDADSRGWFESGEQAADVCGARFELIQGRLV